MSRQQNLLLFIESVSPNVKGTVGVAGCSHFINLLNNPLYRFVPALAHQHIKKAALAGCF